MASVSVVADADDVARLHINNRVQEGSTAGGMVEVRLAQLPLLLHAAPHRALFLGLGTGYTAHAAAVDPQVQVRAVELLPEVIEASNLFMLRPAAPRAAHPVDIVAADARRFVLADDGRYDVIVADLFHPARSGAAGLYTVDHFRAVRERLAPDGLFCQWLALHQMDVATLRSIVAAFMQVYPQGVAVLASNGLDSPVIGLVARPDRPTWTVSAVQSRLARPTRDLGAALKLARIDSAYAVLGSVVADAGELRRFAASSPVNTDDQPVVAERAARVDYAPEALPRERLASLLHVLPSVPSGVLDKNDPDASRLAAYWRARARYLELGLQSRSDPDPRVMLDAIGPDLLALVADSPEFQPAADSLAGLAQGLQGSDYTLSQQVLAELRRVQGARGEAAMSNPPVPSAR
jgi:spermidine synthase